VRAAVSWIAGDAEMGVTSGSADIAGAGATAAIPVAAIVTPARARGGKVLVIVNSISS